MRIDMNHWYHGGNLEEGKPKGTYLYVTNTPGRAKLEANKSPNGKAYRTLHRIIFIWYLYELGYLEGKRVVKSQAISRI